MDQRPGSASSEIQSLRAEVEQCRRAAEKSSEEMQAFAYSVSHDLRAPIRAIEGFSRIILEDFADQVPAEAQKFLQHIISNTQQLSSQIEDLLKFYRLGKNPPQKIRMDANVAAREAVAEQPAGTPPVEIAELSATLGDPGQLRQIFRELIFNAAKASRNNPAPAIQIGSSRADGKVTFFVRDHGVGFDPQHADRLFQVFQKLHSMAEFPGNGMGLALVKRMVEAHHGSVWAESQPDKGSTFFFSLPER